jgi:hypothetical protein
MRNFIEFFVSSDDLKKEQEKALAEMPDVIEEEVVVADAVEQNETAAAPVEETPEENKEA